MSRVIHRAPLQLAMRTEFELPQVHLNKNPSAHIDGRWILAA